MLFVGVPSDCVSLLMLLSHLVFGTQCHGHVGDDLLAFKRAQMCSEGKEVGDDGPMDSFANQLHMRLGNTLDQDGLLRNL